jgi:hypothetical protein
MGPPLSQRQYLHRLSLDRRQRLDTCPACRRPSQPEGGERARLVAAPRSFQSWATRTRPRTRACRRRAGGAAGEDLPGYLTLDGRIRYFRQPVNLGAAANHKRRRQAGPNGLPHAAGTASGTCWSSRAATILRGYAGRNSAPHSAADDLPRCRTHIGHRDRSPWPLLPGSRGAVLPPRPILVVGSGARMKRERAVSSRNRISFARWTRTAACSSTPRC